MPDKFSRVRISDIATKAGVSTGTIDRVLHNRSEVAPATRKKILKIIEEMNYKPDILASTLASKKIYRFASLIPEADDSSQFWTIPAAGFAKAHAQVKHYGIEHEPYFFKYFNKNSFLKVSSELLKSKPDGVILAPIFAGPAKDFVNQCQELDIEVLFINADMANLERLSFVGQDSFRSGMVAARLLNYGTPDDAKFLVVNFISRKSANLHLLNREEGFRAFFSQHSLSHKKLQKLDIIQGDFESINDILNKELLSGISGSLPDGIFVTNSRVFLVADFFARNNINNIRLVGYDLLDINMMHLRNDRIDFLISQKPLVQGYLSFMTLFDHFVLKKTVPKYQYLPIDIITPENLDYYLTNL